MTNIIFVEDNVSYAEDVAEYLGGIGYRVTLAADAAALWAALSNGPADLVLLDLGLPDEDGFNLIPALRRHHPDTRLIVLTARVTLDNRIQGLRLGADTYLTKPIKFRELAAHIEALCRRIGTRELAAPPSPWRLEANGRRLALHGKGTIALTEREFKFLHLLAHNRQPVPRTSLLIGMGESDDPQAAARIDMLVYRLRKKIKTGMGEALPLQSTYGGGYSLSVPFELA
ncbi:DNA-binding response regulator [Noviherbaspirillum cavernae]|uniref:DNA-binding response regulator n=1 Tax=Noviherbaspirillum cavernae TaxID=2320862 RepID=A0A418X4K6_9BURK|nr:response regulator transcription factor [Noviherbaspirillum cavernae]RJG07402.1 DNA-binding response regulator [Noviherbaspirillum cavernae]